MKKNLLSILVLLGTAAMVASCGPKTSSEDTTPTGGEPTDTESTDTTPAHEHSWSDWTVTTPAKCGTDGVETRTCACGETETRPVPATENHTWGEWENTTPSTCTTAGEDTRTCSECGATETREAALSDTHSYDEGVVTTEPTATQDGEMTYTCSECGNTTTEAIPCTGEPVAVGVSKIGSTLVSGLTASATYTSDYMYENFVSYDESDGSYWFAISFGTSATPSTLSGYVTQLLRGSYVTVQAMAEDDGWFYGFFADKGVSEIANDTIIYGVDCYTNSKGATVLQVVGAEATYFMG